jgi:proteasome lid subunit RPN8/RPN11
MTIRMAAGTREQMVKHAYAWHPEESCGLLAGPADRDVHLVFPTTNILHSSTNYTIDPNEHLSAIREADAAGMEIIGVFHSHPHTVGYPSVTDVSLAPDPTWLYVLVGMEDHDSPTVRGFRIRDGEITEVQLEFEETET